MTIASAPTGSLNLVVIHPSANKRSGGIVNAGLSYVEGLLAIGHRVEVWTASQAFADGAERLGAAVTLDRAFRSVLALCAQPSRLVRAIKGLCCADAIIHNNGRLWALACLVRSSRHFVVFHNESIGIRGLFRNWLAISSAQDGRLSAVAARRKPWVLSVSRILNGLSADMRAPVAVRMGAQAPKIGFLAEIRPKKGLDVLLRAASLLHGRGCDFRLVIGGDGDIAGHRQLAGELGLADRIDWLGWVDDRAAFFAGLDIFCLPSRIEPFGIVVTEALARGLPVVASRTDGPIELVEGSRAGLLVDADDPEQLADALAELVGSAALRQEYGIAGRTYVERNFTPAEIGRRLENAVTGVVSTSIMSVQPRKSHG